MKRVSITDRINPSLKVKEELGTKTLCLVRATRGSEKASAHVLFKDHVKFTSQMNTIIRAHVELKKKDKAEKKKAAERKKEAKEATRDAKESSDTIKTKK